MWRSRPRPENRWRRAMVREVQIDYAHIYLLQVAGSEAVQRRSSAWHSWLTSFEMVGGGYLVREVRLLYE